MGEDGAPVAGSDAEIVGWSTAGDAGAFVELFWRHDAAVHAYLVRRAGRDVAEDLVAEVWLRAFKSRATFDSRVGEARPWLYGIARNVLRAHWRLQATLPPVLPAAVSDPWPEIDELIDVRSRRVELEQALLSLSEAEREVLLLVAWEQLRSAQIAVVLDLPQSTVRNRLHRARQAMRARLEAGRDLYDQES